MTNDTLWKEGVLAVLQVGALSLFQGLLGGSSIEGISKRPLGTSVAT